MKKKEWNYLSRRLFGIQKRLLLYLMLLVTLLLILVTIGTSVVVSRNTKKNLMEQYTYINDKFYRSFESIYDSLNAVTESCITNEYVQKSLKNKELGVYDKEILTRTLSFMGSNYAEYYFYLDNKGNSYSLNKLKFHANTFYNSNLYQGMGEDYSKLKLFWNRDYLSGKMDMALFAGRYVRQFDKEYKPGFFYMKLDSDIFSEMIQELQTKDPIYLILDDRGQVCFQKSFQNTSSNKKQNSQMLTEIEKAVMQNRQKKEPKETVYSRMGVIFEKTHAESGFQIVTYVPRRVMNQAFREMLIIIFFIFLLVLGVAFALSSYFSKQFTKPIRYISHLMEHFDDARLDQQAVLTTNTELDYIGASYNKMLERIRMLIDQVRYKEQELRKAELDTLMYQIQPHFLYNTLDTVYMLARLSKEETIMNMIQSLSKYLRINLSNGADEITVEKELEHVKAYLDIQKIRNSGLFEYEIICQEALKEKRILKMILQPIAENCIKHAFDDSEDQGKIKITASETDEEFQFEVENNGNQMSKQDQNRLNRLEKIEITDIEYIVTKGEGGYGISNVVKRLRLRYHDQIRFYYTVGNDFTKCTIKIKKEMMTEHENEEI